MSPGVVPVWMPVLRRGAEALGVTLDATALHRLVAYVGMLSQWNRVYNLTAVRTPEDMVTQHLLDSLSLVAPLRRHLGGDPAAGNGNPARILDVGSGGGLPGVVLAVVQPQWTVVCVDAVLKKSTFVRQVAAELQLPNLQAVHGRVETLTGPRFQVVTCRAFAALADFTKWSRRAVADDGVWAAMKGQHPAAELSELPSEVQVFHVEPLQVPGLKADRCLVWMRPTAPLLSGAIG